MKKLLTILFCLVALSSLAQTPRFKQTVQSNTEGNGFKFVVPDSALGLPRFPAKLDASKVKYMGRKGDALMFADTLHNKMYWYNPHLDSVQEIGSGGGGTTIIGDGAGSGLALKILADGLHQVLPIYVGTNNVSTVQVTSKNGSGMQRWSQTGDSIYVYYGDAPDSVINFQIGIVGSIDTAGLVGGNSGGGGGVIGNPLGNNSLWTYTLDTSCRINYGAQFGLGSTSTNMIALANTGLNYTSTSYNGSGAVNYTGFTSGGYNTLVRINPAAPVTGSYVAISSDSLNFRNSIKTLFNLNGATNVIGAALINEWNNIKHGAGFWNPISAQNTINQFRAGGNALHELGLKAYDGGVTGDPLFFLVYEDYANRGFPDSAAAFIAKVFPAGINLTNWRSDTAHSYMVNYTDSVLSAFHTLPMDGVNVHFKETVLDSDSANTTIDPNTFKSIVRYLHRKTGKPVITNEFGTNNNINANILSQLIDAIEDLHDAKNGDMSIAIWYNYGLANSDGSLTPFGTALKNKITETRIAQ